MMRGFFSGGLLAALLLVAACGQQQQAVIHTPDDAAKARIGVMTGSTGEAIVFERYPDAGVNSFDDIMDAVTALHAGQLDAVVTGFPAALQVARKNPGLVLLDEPLAHEDTAIAVRKEDTALLERLNAIIAHMQQDGTLADMQARWFKLDPGPYEEPELQLPDSGPPLRVGVSATREPFSFVDRDGRVTGHDGELARRIAAELGRPLEFFDMKFMALIPALDSGKVDLIITGMTATEERRKSVDFSVPYYANAQVMLVRSATQAGTTATTSVPVSGLAGLARARIAVLPGSAGDLAARSYFPDAAFQTFTVAADAALAVRTGKADAFVYDKSVLLNLQAHNPGLQILAEPVAKLEIAPAVSREQPELAAAIGAILDDLAASGELERLRNKWIATDYDRPPRVEAPVPVPGTNVLRVGTSAEIEPFSFVADGQFSGLDIELAYLIAGRLGRGVEILNMSFDALIPALHGRRIDVALSNFNVTEERKTQVLFPRAYVENDISALVTAAAAASDGEGTATSRIPASFTTPAFLQGVVDGFYSNIIQENRYLLLWSGLQTTVVISVFATLFGTLLGSAVCFMRMSANALLRLPAQVFISILRGTPVLVVLMLIFYVVFASVDISPVLVAVIAFGLNFAAYAAEIFRSGILGVDRGQTEAGIAMGFSRIRTFLYIVLPQTIQRILPVYKGEFISLVKMTSVVGYIAVQDLTKASDIIRSRTFDAFFPLVMVAILYFIISWVLIQFLEYLERKTDPKQRRRQRAKA